MNTAARSAAVVIVVAVIVLIFWWVTSTRGVDPSALGLGGSDQSSATTPSIQSGKPWFRECAAARGLDFRHVSAFEPRFFFPEIMCGGVALFDHDGDGDLDIYVTQGGDLDTPGDPRAANRLYANDGAGTFTDVTASAGVGDTGYGMGAAVGDIDRDGDLDLFVANVGGDVLYRNDGGGHFTDVTATSGINGRGWSSSASFVDHDRDGDLDLFVTQYIRWSKESERICYAEGGRKDYCSPLVYNAAARDLLYENDGHGVFKEVGEELGLSAAFGNGLGCVCADFDGDGWIDIYVANDGTPNQLWRNNEGQLFTDVAARNGVAVNREGRAEAGMGVIAFDAENDGDLDIFLTHLVTEHNTIYVQEERGLFAELSSASGLAWPSLPFTGFGVGYGDFDHDGCGDIHVANGRVSLGTQAPDSTDPYAEINLLFAGDGKGKFTEVLPRGGTDPSLVRCSRASAFGDLDNDGDIDIVIVERDRPLTLLENVIAAPDRWIRFIVLDARGHQADGAMVTLATDRREQWRLVQPSSSYQAANDPRIHFGLGADESITDVRVRWLDGAIESFGVLDRARTHELRRGEGR